METFALVLLRALKLFLSRLLQIGINGNFTSAKNSEMRFLQLSRLLQIGINGNNLLLPVPPQRRSHFPDYFKSELMETPTGLGSQRICCLSRLLQIGINGNDGEWVCHRFVVAFPDYFKSELMETLLIG